MATSVDMRATSCKLIWLANSDVTFYMDLSNLYESLSEVTFSFDGYDTPNPDNANTVEINTTISTDGTIVYVTLEDTQPEMDTDRLYYFHFSDSNDESLCYGTIIRKGLM